MKVKAEEFGEVMKTEGYGIKVHLIEGEANPDGEWSVVATKVLSSKDISNIGKLDDEIANLAIKFGGDFDGHKIPIS